MKFNFSLFQSSLLIASGALNQCDSFSVSYLNIISPQHADKCGHSSSFIPFINVYKERKPTHLYVNPNTLSNGKYTLSDRETDMKRLMFQLNQVKGEIVEAELRATAAEQRVLELKTQAENISEKEDNLSKRFETMFEEERKVLEDKVESLANALQELKFGSHDEIMNLKTESAAESKQLNEEKRKLESALSRSAEGLKLARVEIEGYEQDRSDFADKTTRAKLEAHSQLINAKNEGRAVADGLQLEIASLNVSLEEAVSELKNANEDAKQMKASRLELEEMLQALKSELENTTNVLKQETQNEKLRAAQQLVSAKESNQREKDQITVKKDQIIGEKEAIILEKDSTITEYEEELASVRKMTKQSLRLIRGRFSSLIGKRKST